MIVKDHEIPYYQQKYIVAKLQFERMRGIQEKGEFKYKYKYRVFEILRVSYNLYLDMQLVKDEYGLYINREDYDRLESVASRFNMFVKL